MKYVKMLGLAAVAAAALMAFVGASTASATVLCKTPGTGSPTGTTCPEGWAYGANTTIHAVATGPTILEDEGKAFTVECKKSTLHATTTNEGNATETPVAHVLSLLFEECDSEVKVLANGSLEVHWIEGTHNGTLTSTGAEVTITKSTIFGKVHCIFKTNNTSVGDITGGNPAIFHSTAKIPKLTTSALCPEPAIWTATYEITEPTPLYVTGHT